MNKNSIKNNYYLGNFGLFILLINLMTLTGCTEEIQEAHQAESYCIDEFMHEKITIDSALNIPVTEILALTGKVEYNTDKVVSFMSLVGGIITNTYFSIGDQVKKGQLLAEIKSTELSSLLSQKRTIQLQIQVAERELDYITTMYEDKIAAQKEMVEAQSNLEVLRAELENTTAQLELYSASSERGVFQIKAPSSGTIVNKNITAGMQITAEGDPLFTIADLSEVWIMANVYIGNVTYVKENMNVEIKALSYPDHVFKGKVNALSQVFDAEENVLKARIVMSNSDNKLMPGMLVDVFVEKELGISAIAVPLNALIFYDNQNFLLIYKDNCNLEIRPVVPFVQNTNQVFFQNNLVAGEKIITTNHLLIYNQLKELK